MQSFVHWHKIHLHNKIKTFKLNVVLRVKMYNALAYLSAPTGDLQQLLRGTTRGWKARLPPLGAPAQLCTNTFKNPPAQPCHWTTSPIPLCACAKKRKGCISYPFFINTPSFCIPFLLPSTAKNSHVLSDIGIELIIAIT